MTAHEECPDLVDSPKGHFFIEIGNELYFCLVVKRHRTNLHQMNKIGLLSEENKKQVVERLVKFNERTFPLKITLCHGDIKES